jgi:PhnB protein
LPPSIQIFFDNSCTIAYKNLNEWVKKLTRNLYAYLIRISFTIACNKVYTIYMSESIDKKIIAFPYLNFEGDCRQAMEWYASILGAELSIFTYKQSGAPLDPKWGDMVMNAKLSMGDMIIMASDVIPQYSPPLLHGSNMQVALVLPDFAEGKRVYDILSQGGIAIGMPYQAVPWADGYAMLTDKYNIGWQINGGWHPDAKFDNM